MTVEEVVDVFKETRKEINFKSELLDKAIEALEKQIPKSIVSFTPDGMFYDENKCPSCNSELGEWFSIVNYCPNCGQRLERP